MTYTVEIEDHSGKRATKEYDTPAYMLMVAVDNDLRDYPHCQVIRIWRTDGGHVVFKMRSHFGSGTMPAVDS